MSTPSTPSTQPAQEARAVVHPQLGPGTIRRTYMGGYEWEVEFASGRRFRLPAREFDAASVEAWRERAGGAASPPPATGTEPRAAVLEIDQFRARQTLEALRLGIVPIQDVETLTIGLEAEQVSLDRALARGKERGGDVQAVIGDYGFGKSHFVELAARRALREGFLVASASLDLVEVPPGRARDIYAALVRALRYPDTERRGLRPLLERALERPGVVDAFVAASPIPAYCPLSAALKALEVCSSQDAYDDIVAWIGGAIRPTSALRACLRKPPALYATGEVARQYAYLLSAIGVLASLAGYSGLAVLIDESEHYSLLRAAQRGRADAFFKALIYGALGPANSRVDPTSIQDHARADYPLAFSSTPHLFFLFALTESENRMPVDAWLAPSAIVRLDDRFIERDIRAFFGTLQHYHGLAYDYTPDPERHAEVAVRAPTLLSRALGQHRINVREVIRLTVAVCDLLYLYPEDSPERVLGELGKGLGV